MLRSSALRVYLYSSVPVQEMVFYYTTVCVVFFYSSMGVKCKM